MRSNIIGWNWLWLGFALIIDIGIAILVGLTAWDTQQLKKMGQQV